jgi:hypothetical protein
VALSTRFRRNVQHKLNGQIRRLPNVAGFAVEAGDAERGYGGSTDDLFAALSVLVAKAQ